MPLVDILWHNAQSNETRIWRMGRNNAGKVKVGQALDVLGDDSKPATTGLPWSIVGVDPLLVPHGSSILWHNAATNEVKLWFVNGERVFGSAFVTDHNRPGENLLAPPPLRIVGMGKFFKSDETSDILLHDAVSNATVTWKMRRDVRFNTLNTKREGGGDAITGLPWSIVGIGDFNLDGLSDILWHNQLTNEIKIWFMDGNNGVSSSANVQRENGADAHEGLPWKIVGVGNFSLEGFGDILWHNERTNEIKIWVMQDPRKIGPIGTLVPRVGHSQNILAENGIDQVAVGLPWSIVGVGNFFS